jgi:hypothetical protein
VVQFHRGVEFSDGRTLVKKSRFSEEKVIPVLKQAEASVKLAELAGWPEAGCLRQAPRLA